jgi:chemotaxis protein CheD
MLLELQPTEEEAVVRSERNYKSKILVEPVAGSAELF